ncbi:pyridoxal-phosphate dependent enzyme [Dyella choica]|uniref:L-serine ammonia-lyase n=1 Tax=Dyella choica TaxID=1927959 RepID=A0A3S0PNG9_9GAMM|nr:pyridoxal-phosphate dependent enzyme [Dyella choica]RUL77533.1 pyridoxal-phosphate dependent enzyme [Dyella choica]
MITHFETPLLESRALSRRCMKTISLKMEAWQPTGSFKNRGMGYACSIYRERGAERFISSSGGNAGLAVAYAGRKLGVPVVVVVPKTTPERARRLIAREDAEVIVHGDSWNEADAFARSLVHENDAFIHPFDDELLWMGHASMIDEIARSASQPDAIILSVGGGGLLCGVIEGLRRNDWHNVPVIAAETVGADSYAQALKANRVVNLPAISSIATSLGARAVSSAALRAATQHPVESAVVSDAAAVAGCLELLEEHRVVVEPACGASVAALDADLPALQRARNVIVIVCGGVNASVEQLHAWSRTLAVA